MTNGHPPGDSRALLHSVARMHYLSDLTQVEISRRMGVSPATVSRWLHRARAEGIVRIEVRDLPAVDTLAVDVAARLGLRRVAVVDYVGASTPAALAGALGDIMRKEPLAAGSVLMIGWGRAIQSVIAAGLPSLPGLVVVPATGGLQQHAPHFQINEFARIAAEATGGVPHFIHAPNLPSAEARDVFLSDPDIAQAVSLWNRIDLAIVGIGVPFSKGSVEASVATSNEKQLTGAVGDVVRHYFDENGNAVPWEGEDRMIAAMPEHLHSARLCVGVATGTNKAAAIIGAARARLVSGLVTDLPTAMAVLERLDLTADASAS